MRVAKPCCTVEIFLAVRHDLSCASGSSEVVPNVECSLSNTLLIAIEKTVHDRVLPSKLPKEERKHAVCPDPKQ